LLCIKTDSLFKGSANLNDGFETSSNQNNNISEERDVEYEETFRILKIDRTLPYELEVIDDEVVYYQNEMMDLLAMIENGNKASGGLQKVATCYGILGMKDKHHDNYPYPTKMVILKLGFIKFLEGYYIILITKKSVVALIGGHYIYHIDDTLLVPIPGPATKIEHKHDEAR
jgi:hypothetical protein